MGNCQAAEAATVLIHHPGNRVERIYWSVSANHVMRSNPGHYVALVIPSPTAPSHRNNAPPPSKQLKLLKPDDTLLIGNVYRLVSFEDVLKEFAAKKCVKLGKLLEKTEGLSLGLEMELKRKHSAGSGPDKNPSLNPNPKSGNCDSVKVEDKLVGSNTGVGGSDNSNRYVGRHVHGGGQWRPALQSIAEVGT